MDSFYLTLLSEADQSFYSNTAYHFVNRMRPEIQLDSQMEVAVAEISFSQIMESPNPNPNDKPQMFVFDFLFPSDKKNKKYGKWYKFNFEQEKFGSAEELCLLLNEKLWKYIPRLRKLKSIPFTYDPQMKRIWYEYTPKTYYLVLIKGYLLRLTGLSDHDKPKQIVALGKSKRARAYVFNGETRMFAPDCQSAFRSFCDNRNFFKVEPLVSNSSWSEFIIYSNLVEPNHVGSDMISQLRFVTLHQKNAGKVMTQTFESRFYFPVAVSFINDARIELRHSTGVFVPFKGSTRVVLHFRRKN